eukprot:10241919-Alexandrium_andersonii.AAC.1
MGGSPGATMSQEPPGSKAQVTHNSRPPRELHSPCHRSTTAPHHHITAAPQHHSIATPQHHTHTHLKLLREFSIGGASGEEGS